jgi:hypothetical protein
MYNLLMAFAVLSSIAHGVLVEMEVQLLNHPKILAFVLISLSPSSLGATHIPHETIYEGLYYEPNSFALSF